MKDLTQCRIEIDDLDQQILKLLSERTKVAEDVAKYKLAHNQSISDPRREASKLKNLQQLGQDIGLPASLIHDVYRQIMAHTVAFEQRYIVAAVNSQRLERNTSVAFLGPIGTYSHLAAHRYLEAYLGNISNKCCQDFEEVVAAVESSECEYGLLPIENSNSGSINEVLDVLQTSKVSIVGELFFPIDHSVITCERIELNKISDIYSHPQPVLQCSRYLKDFLPQVRIHYTKSTSEALEIVAAKKDPAHAAIASHHAATYYDLLPLMDNIANNVHNYTRFICISMTPIALPSSIEAKTSLSFSVDKFTPGTLLKVLDEFSAAKINVVKLCSRPRLDPGHATWEEIFFADVQGNTANPVMQDILENIKSYTNSLKVLGCYPSADRHEHKE